MASASVTFRGSLPGADPLPWAASSPGAARPCHERRAAGAHLDRPRRRAAGGRRGLALRRLARSAADRRLRRSTRRPPGTRRDARLDRGALRADPRGERRGGARAAGRGLGRRGCDAGAAGQAVPSTRASRATDPARPASPPPGGQQPNPRYSFDQFVIGGSNRFAHAAALAVAENPGTAYNPLYLCGPPGVGKTHLLHAIATYLEHYAGGLRIRLTTAEAFANEFIGALQGGGIDGFKARHRDVDVLLVDDVQFLMAKARTEEEFFHTFNDLREAGAQIVLTSDRPPARPRQARGPAPRSLRVRARRTGPPARPADPADRPAQARRARRDRRAAGRGHRRHRPAHHGEPPRARGRADPRRGVRLAHLQGRRRRPRRRGARRARAGPRDPGAAARPDGRRDPAADLRGVRRVPSRTCSPPRAPPASPGPGRSPCTSRASTPTPASPTIGAEFGGRGHTTVIHACRRTAERIAADPEVGRTVHRPVDTPVERSRRHPTRPARMTDCAIHRQRPGTMRTRTPAGFSRPVDIIDSLMTSDLLSRSRP